MLANMRANQGAYRAVVTAWRGLSSQSKGTKGPSKKTPKKETVMSSDTSGQASATRNTDGTTYECQEYYGHNDMTFYDYFVDMSKHRLKQPSNKA